MSRQRRHAAALVANGSARAVCLLRARVLQSGLDASIVAWPEWRMSRKLNAFEACSGPEIQLVKGVGLSGVAVQLLLAVSHHLQAVG